MASPLPIGLLKMPRARIVSRAGFGEPLAGAAKASPANAAARSSAGFMSYRLLRAEVVFLALTLMNLCFALVGHLICFMRPFAKR
jgi:hypothetical protein